MQISSRGCSVPTSHIGRGSRTDGVGEGGNDLQILYGWDGIQMKMPFLQDMRMEFDLKLHYCDDF